MLLNHTASRNRNTNLEKASEVLGSER